MAVIVPTWTNKNTGDSQPAAEINQLANGVINNAEELQISQQDISTIQANLSGVQSDISTLDSSVTTLGSNLSTEITNRTNADTNLQNQVDQAFSILDSFYFFSQTISSNGSNTSYSFAHSIPGITGSSVLLVNAKSNDAGGFKYVTLDVTNITIVYTSAPPSGTNNLSYFILIRKQ